MDLQFEIAVFQPAYQDRIIEVASGMPYEEFLERRLFGRSA